MNVIGACRGALKRCSLLSPTPPLFPFLQPCRYVERIRKSPVQAVHFARAESQEIDALSQFDITVDGKPLGRITQGVLKHLVGKSVDEEGNIWNDSGKKLGKAELIPEDELEELLKEPSPFEAFPDATINGEGYAIFEGERVGKLVEGDAKKLRGMKIDADGDVLSKYGETLGKVERWEPEEGVCGCLTWMDTRFLLKHHPTHRPRGLSVRRFHPPANLSLNHNHHTTVTSIEVPYVTKRRKNTYSPS